MCSVPDEECWLPAPGFAGWYEASCLGNVFSLPRAGTAGGLIRPVLVNGYRVVVLSRYGRVTSVPVGRLVLSAFSGPANGRRARHLGARDDDRLGNLYWG